MNQQVVECIYAAVDEANLERPGKPPIEKSLETPIFGTGETFDSLGLINFLVAVEENVERGFGVAIVLGEGEDFDREPSPFRSIGALAEHIETALG